MPRPIPPAPGLCHCGAPADPDPQYMGMCTPCYMRMTLTNVQGQAQAARMAAQAGQAAGIFSQHINQQANRHYRPRSARAMADMLCVRCGTTLPIDTPSWMSKCPTCYRETKQEEHEALMRRALEAENKVELAKKVVMQLQGKLRAAEGQVRKMQGQVGLQKGPPMAGAMGLDRATLERMRRLCHPDKHGNSQAAHEVTQLLNQLLNQP